MSYAGIPQLAPLMIAVPLMGAAVLAPLTKYLPRLPQMAFSAACTAAVMAMGIILALYTSAHGPIVYWLGAWPPHHGLALGISLTVDPIGASLASFISLLVFAAMMYTWRYFDLVGTLFHSLLLLFLGAMCGYALTGDVFNMFVWFELMTAAAIALTAHKIEEASSIEGAINLAVTNTVAGFVVLLGIALLYGRTDALNMAQMGQTLAARPADALVVVALTLIVCGYFVKGAVAPFHFWLDDAHAVAPTPVCVLFSGIMVQLALYGVARMYWTVFAHAMAPHVDVLRPLLIGVGIATALGGAYMAFSQRHLKRLLAFSTVSHSGMFVCALGLFNAAGIAAAGIFIVAHGLIKAALFICAGNFLNRFKSLDEEVLGGKGRLAPVNAALYLIGGIALAGVPPFGIAGAKVVFDAAMKDHGLFAVAMVVAFASAIDAAAVLRSGIHIAWGIGTPQQLGETPREEVAEVSQDSLRRLPWTMLAPAALLLGIAIWIGMSPAFWDAMHRMARAFVDQSAYIAVVFAHAYGPLPGTAPEHRTTEDIITNLSVTAFAILVALAALYREKLPQVFVRGFSLFVSPVLFRIRSIHSGIFTDYIAYLVFGLAAYGVWLVAAIR